MSGARIITIGPATMDDDAGRFVARALQVEGVPVASRQIVDEDAEAVEAALGAALGAPGLVVVLDPPGGSGGEIARRMLARLSGSRLVLNDRLRELLERDCARRDQAMPRRLDRLALLPRGAELVCAADGAPGWTMETAGVVVVVLPHGSASLPSLVDERLLPLARRRLGGESSAVRTLYTTGLPPADVEDRLGAWLGREGPVAVSTSIVEGDVWVRVLARGASHDVALRLLTPVEKAVREALGDACFGRDTDTLEAVVGGLMIERGLRVSVAESCTGGLLGHRLTAVAGSSRYFERGIVAYSNRAKIELLGVPPALIDAHGAVSAEVASAMVDAMCRASGSPCSLAVTGNAGPDDTATAAAGTVFIACAGPWAPSSSAVRRLHFGGGRDAVKWRASQAALDMLRRGLVRWPPSAPR